MPRSHKRPTEGDRYKDIITKELITDLINQLNINLGNPSRIAPQGNDIRAISDGPDFEPFSPVSIITGSMTGNTMRKPCLTVDDIDCSPWGVVLGKCTPEQTAPIAMTGVSWLKTTLTQTSGYIKFDAGTLIHSNTGYGSVARIIAREAPYTLVEFLPHVADCGSEDCDFVFTEHKFDNGENCVHVSSRLISLTVIDNCIHKEATQWGNPIRLERCNTDFSFSADSTSGACCMELNAPNYRKNISPSFPYTGGTIENYALDKTIVRNGDQVTLTFSLVDTLRITSDNYLSVSICNLISGNWVFSLVSGTSDVGCLASEFDNAFNDPDRACVLFLHPNDQGCTINAGDTINFSVTFEFTCDDLNDDAADINEILTVGASYRFAGPWGDTYNASENIGYTVGNLQRTCAEGSTSGSSPGSTSGSASSSSPGSSSFSIGSGPPGSSSGGVGGGL